MKDLNSVQKNGKVRLLYIENLRILLTALVVIVHVACTYGGPGGWAYIEKGATLATILPLTILNATSQSFFMGMFFFISAYFTQVSLERKGITRFVLERIIRLGLPLAISYFFISVLVAYIIWPVKYPDSEFGSFIDLWLSGRPFGFGVMWFVLALFYLTAIYLVIYALFFGNKRSRKIKLPKIKMTHILLSATIIGVVTFFVRIRFPLFTSSGIRWLPFDLGHFPQYLFLFAFGTLAARFDNDSLINLKQAKKWLAVVAFMIFIAFPLLFFLGEAHIAGVKSYAGRGTLNSLAYAVWEQVSGFAIMAALWGFFKANWNSQSKLSAKLSNSAFAVYAIHPPVLVGISYIFVSWKTMLLIKFLALAPLALVCSFAIGLLIKKIPLLKRIY